MVDSFLEDKQRMIAAEILKEIRTRLKFLLDVGLDYLSLNRTSVSLSGGESQRINLATSLGSNLTGSLYILDEPSIGLHPLDVQSCSKSFRPSSTKGRRSSSSNTISTSSVTPTTSSIWAPAAAKTAAASRPQVHRKISRKIRPVSPAVIYNTKRLTAEFFISQ